jgi:3-hydroxyisobutyrate dehydrogenase-like beta-hydroxyacid dehydrogenase
MQLGFIGIGTMGNPMACCLIEAGHQLTVHDLRREAATNLCEMGARWVDSPYAVAEASEVAFTSSQALERWRKLHWTLIMASWLDLGRVTLTST